MTSEYFLLVLKVSSLAIAGLLGVIGLLNDFKDKQGKLTRWGKVSLLGLVLSGAVGVGTELIDSERQKEEERKRTLEAREQRDQIFEQLSIATETQGNVERVLGDTEATLNQQGKLMAANRTTMREVDRGLTPLGQHVALVYEVVISTRNWRFPLLKQLLDQQIDEFMTNAPKPQPPPYRSGYKAGNPYSTSFRPRQGLTLFVQVNSDQTETPVELQFGPNASLRLTNEGWDRQLFGGAMGGQLELWKTGNPTCPLPDKEPSLTFGHSVASGEEPMEGFFESLPDAGVENVYRPKEERLEQHGSLRLKKGVDDGTITSVLDLENALVKIDATLPSDVVTRELKVCFLQIYAGHSVIRVEPNRITQCGNDLIVRLPSHITPRPVNTSEALLLEDNMCRYESK
jgi:hypothetical protein